MAEKASSIEQTHQKKIINPTEEYQRFVKVDEPPIRLYICTIFPGVTNEEGKTVISEEMDFVKHKLSKIKGLEPHFIWVKSGTFSHRHLKDVPDPDQIKHRNIYLNKVPDGEWLLVLDADELLFGALANIPIILRILNANPDVDYAMISELLPTGELKLRPRLIRKREGLVYGGPDKKHDYISHNIHHENYLDGDCIDFGDHTDRCVYNYIDVNAESRSWILDFLGFFHYKNGWAMELYSDDTDVKFELPSNMVHLNNEALEKTMEEYPTEEFDVSSVSALNESMQRELDKDKKRYNMYKEIVRD